MKACWLRQHACGDDARQPWPYRQKLAASLPTQLIYLCVVVAALGRVLAAFEPSSALLHVATFAWALAFGGFAVIFGPLLLGRSSMRTGNAPR
jgi:uncharacterized protein involved in response to NO